MMSVEQKKETVLTPEADDLQKYALISTSDKEGITDLAKVVNQVGYKIISSGGTARALAKAEVDVLFASEITGNPEVFSGRVKTISFQIASGILFDRQNSEHIRQARELNIPQIDIVICNLYPFVKLVEKPETDIKEAIENIDVGGPTMIRAAAKNFKNVLVVVDPRDYPEVAGRLKEKSIDEDFRRKMASKAFVHLSSYDSAIGNYLLSGHS